MRAYIVPAAIVIGLSGCATAPTYDNKVGASLASTSKGNVKEALTRLETHLEGSNKTDLLLNLEKGELLRIDARYKDSQSAFEVADVRVNAWEAMARSTPEKLFGQVGATIMGDNSRDYEGQDYEKVMLTTRMAMNRISLGDFDTARVDIKRTHEREAVIAQFRAQEALAAEEEAKVKGVKAEAKELNGYPIETLNDPEVLKLKNGYQNALSHYMAGFLYEALNEPGLAAPGYRKAVELRPGLPVLEEGLRGLDQRTSFRRKKGMTDVLFIIEAGNAPARKAQKIMFPVPTPNGLITVGAAFPIIVPDNDPPLVSQISLSSAKAPVQLFPTALITDFNVMARKALKDELPGIQIRAAVRAVAKGLLQNEVNRQLGPLGGLIGNIAAVATESNADDRMWRSLPERVFIARAFVAPGDYTLQLPNASGPAVTRSLTVNGRYMVVPVRMFRDNTYFGEAAQYGSIGAVAQNEAPAPKNVKDKRPAAPKAKRVATTL